MSGGQNDPGGTAGQGGGTNAAGAGLPPKAPAYDLRTGERLDASRKGEASDTPDFDDLGIWAPSREDPGPGAEQPYQVPYQQSSYQATPPPPTQLPPTQLPHTQFSGGQAPYNQGPGQAPYNQAPSTQVEYGQNPQQYLGPPTGPGYAPTLASGGPPSGRRGPALLAGVVGALVVAVAVLVGVLLFGRSSSGQLPVASTGTGQASTSGGGSTGTTSGSGSQGTSSGNGDSASRVAFLRTVDGILTQSASGRQQVSSVVTGVVNGCSVSPSTASATIRQVIVNRQSVLAQTSSLNPPDAATRALQTKLVAALNASIDANRGYQQWLDNLYATYYSADPVGCPDGRAPTDSNYDAATAASGRATAAKQSFVADYNPLASAAGLRSWSESEF
jgi:hypothetical protein